MRQQLISAATFSTLALPLMILQGCATAPPPKAELLRGESDGGDSSDPSGFLCSEPAADKDDLVVVAVLVEHVPGVDLFRMAAVVILPHRLIEAVVEIEEFEVLKLGARGAEQLFDQLNMAVHRAANIEEHQ